MKTVSYTHLLALQILPLNPVEQEGILTRLDVIEDGFGRNSASLVLKMFRDRCCGEGCSDVGDDISDDTLQQINITYLVSFYDILENHRVVAVSYTHLVVYSTEQPCTTGETIGGEGRIPGSISFVPSVAGLILAGFVVKDLLNQSYIKSKGTNPFVYK